MLLLKKELVFKLLRMANDISLNEATVEKNVEQYIKLVDAREEIIDKLKELDIKLDPFKETSLMSKELLPISQEIREMTDQIARMETDIQRKASGIMVNLQREISSINNRKKESGEQYTPGMLYESKV